MKKRYLRPGQKAKASGQYKVVGTKREVTAVKGKPLPPTRRQGLRYKLTDKTKH